MKWFKLLTLMAELALAYISYTEWRANCGKCGHRHCDGTCDS